MLLGLKVSPTSAAVRLRQERVIKLIRSHRRAQEKAMEVYRRREEEFARKLKELVLDDWEPSSRAAELASTEPEEDRPSLIHG